jgi:hypothetical protein
MITEVTSLHLGHRLGDFGFRPCILEVDQPVPKRGTAILSFVLLSFPLYYGYCHQIKPLFANYNNLYVIIQVLFSYSTPGHAGNLHDIRAGYPLGEVVLDLLGRLPEGLSRQDGIPRGHIIPPRGVVHQALENMNIKDTHILTCPPTLDQLLAK